MRIRHKDQQQGHCRCRGGALQGAGVYCECCGGEMIYRFARILLSIGFIVFAILSFLNQFLDNYVMALMYLNTAILILLLEDKYKK
jgi:hypothetical protein